MTLSSYEKPFGALWNAVPLFSQYPLCFPLDSWGLNPWQPLLTLCRNIQSYLLYPMIILLTMIFVLCGCSPSLNINLTLKRQEYIFNYTKLWVSNVAFVGLHAGLYNWKEVLFIYVIWSRRISHKKCRAKCLPKCLTKCLPNCLPNCLAATHMDA